MTNDRSSDHKGIRRIIQQINECWRDKDYDAIGDFLADGVVIAPPGFEGRMAGRKAYVQSYRDYDRSAATHAFSPGDPEIDVVGDVAVAVCPYSVEYELDGRRHRENGRDVLVFSHADAGWRVVWRTMLAEASEAAALLVTLLPDRYVRERRRLNKLTVR